MDDLENRVASIRRFSRFYTRRIGVLHEGLLGSPLSLAEGRVVWELAQRERATASELAVELGLDSGYLSRILAGFEQKTFKAPITIENALNARMIAYPFWLWWATN